MAKHNVYDVAQKAEVSIATVSRVINSPEKVNEATRKRVLRAIDELGFVPKAEAAARARKAGRRIGVLSPFLTYPSFVQRLRGISNTIASSPYELLIYNVDDASRRDAYLASLPVTQRLDGLIIMTLPFDEATARRLRTFGLETVLIEFQHPAFSSITIDNRAGGRLAAEYLLSKGHRRFGFVGEKDLPAHAIPTSDWRREGYCQVLAEAGFAMPETYIALAPLGLEPARAAALRLMDLPEPPTAIFASNDTQAVGVLKAARERGLAIPQNLAVLGFDDVEFADYVGLTTIRQQLEESGRVAAELLLSRLTDPTRPTQHVRLPLEIVKRGTA